jgi:hypothetical protein
MTRADSRRARASSRAPAPELGTIVVGKHAAGTALRPAGGGEDKVPASALEPDARARRAAGPGDRTRGSSERGRRL